MRTQPRLRRLLLTVLIACGGLVLVAGLGYREGSRRALDAQSAQAAQQLDLQAQALNQRIERYRALPQVLALDPDLRAAVAAPVDADAQARLNQRLEEANRTTRASTLTLIDARGIAIAASNWRDAGSNVGEDYAFRPYVQQALRDGRGRFYGIGVTTSVPGYFLSEALRDDAGRAVGVIAIKIELAAIEQTWPDDGDLVLASDAHDVVFLASRAAWRYRVLAPLDTEARQELVATRQYEGEQLRAYAGQVLRNAGAHGAVVRVDMPAMPGTWLWQRAPVADTDWTLHLLHDAAPIAAAGREWATIAGVSWAALVFLTLFLQQRVRLGALRRRSRDELETLVRHHAEELRSARDGLVAAAQEADTGLSRRLAHLPQGVVIIDAALRIVAWNARYIELFRFPPDLVRVGTPIEEVFRYNARRGLLGPGPVEEAIERRLEHLRSGKPHMRESEKYDGTVLEIRGNPLPDGGFVTSYADITTYKTTARELRTLADALERRIAERTADLEQARAEAEAANRYKGRFAAAAVHDLLQPLNAARMFAAGLRARLRDDETRRIADNIEGALSAQDGILASLLDISRLETGTLRTDIREVALGPLLEGLARETGVLAQARGLRFDHVPTRVWVRSDATLLRRLVQNFLSNAVRYTARGRIVLGVRRDGDRLWIEVHDTGPGIPPNRQREIFEEFRRLDDGNAGDRGAGLGLAIVDRIARLLGHRIDLRSRPGTGSVFRVCLPLSEAPAQPVIEPIAPGVPAEDDAPLRGCRVWVIDDDPQICAATRQLLERWDCDVPLADGPHAALAAAVRGEAPDIVLLDVRMGEHHGPTLFETLCDRWSAVPLAILVTGETDPALRTRARDAGQGFLPKPVRPPALRALMMQMRLRGY
ncbi:PAS-domain containing protein [Luteimonas fraxinea]|uniref:histidine kinase n=1 Tax=Luteimonas fraxinea TaxID=2901869 RepID=A0ABS8U698_9GAMM|nr:PAS-domain containing protein [Luteimonas fraxinea]MCD9095337.1 PAS-domain containing protein [Luteimonas fraxinea]MCD9126405.1 PAS-domain containing protein [Luteimonas fraxinea]UHH11448.1 PAS-domain containing protein [Luteimonas fraxinea]